MTTKEQTLRALNQSRGTVLCAQLENAGGVAGQSKGLLGRDSLEPGAGMLFENSRFTPMMWMHMFFMRFAIDIVFLGRGNKVISISRQIRPWRVSAMVFGARRALELEAGAAERSSTQVGDQIRFETIG
jgi:uncharacterized membrane protein (UPF0127 family)